MRRVIHDIAHALRRIVGAPDYAAYLAHMRTHHPGDTVLASSEFERQRLSARYDRPGARCC